MYHFFAKLGYHKRQTEWFTILIVRIVLGVFFILSGFFKIFDTKQQANLLQTLKDAHFPLAEFNAYFIPFLQLICGILILVGLLTTVASFILFVIMIIALATDRAASVAHHGGIMTLEHFLYLPEVLYGLMFLWLFFSGPGKVSIDYKYGKSKRLKSY